MNIYISSFITGFEDVVRKDLPQRLVGAKIKEVYNGLLVYEYNGNWTDIKKVKYLNNTFRVFKLFYDKGLSFASMVAQTNNLKSVNALSADSFRVRFSLENQFSRVNKGVSIAAEQQLCRMTKMRIDRVNPHTEFWYIIRRENVGFFAQLLEKRKVTEKNLNHGELRPELVSLLCSSIEIHDCSVICDPFCGYGAIPSMLATQFKSSIIFASDVDSKKIRELKESRLSSFPNVAIHEASALNLTYLQDMSVDFILTDPPWGIYERIDDIEAFYTDVLKEFSRVLKITGVLICLTAKKEEFKTACINSDMRINKQIDTLVNGKKAAVFICTKLVQ